MTRSLVCTLAVMCAVTAAASAAAQVLEVATLNTEQVRGLDRQKTAVILPGGILEEHGPYLPSYADGYYKERLARDLAEAVAGRPGWTALLFPPIPLGTGGANQIGRKHSFPGSFTVRASTLRTIFMDLGDELGELDFRWVFVVHSHGSPPHNRALDEAARYFNDTYGGRMVHLLGGMDKITCCSAWKKLASQEALAEDGLTVHAGLAEHSAILFLRPDLLPQALGQARSVTADGFPALEAAAKAGDWPGYFGAPRHATSALGSAFYHEDSRHFIDSALQVLDGQEGPAVPRYADTIVGNPVIRGIVVDALAHDTAREARQGEWLAKQPAWPPPPAPQK